MRGLATLCLIVLALAAPGAAWTQSVTETGVDRPGGDFFMFETPVDDPAMCRTACLEHGQCQAYTYVRPGVQGPAGRCYLKRSVPEARPDPCCTSGVRPAHATYVRPADALPFQSTEERQRVGWGGRRVEGVIPMLVVVLRFSGADKPAYMASQNTAFFRDLAFALASGLYSEAQSIQSYYWEASDRRLWLVPATPLDGVIGPVDASEAGVPGAVAAADARINFADFDRNDDGVVNSRELTIITIDNNSSAGAYATGACADSQDRDASGRIVRVCGGAFAGLNSRVINPIHEIAHLYGGIDSYGPWGTGLCWNGGLTLMSCTAGPADAVNGRLTFAFDPWHRMAFGWTTPRLVPLDQASTWTLDIPQSQDDQPLLLYDPQRGLNEFYLVEARGTGAGGHDFGASGSGLVIWYVRTDGLNGRPVSVPGRISARPPRGTLDGSVMHQRDVLTDTDRNGIGDTIEDGPDNVTNTAFVFESAIDSRDLAVDTNNDGINDTIRPGNDGLLQTVLSPLDTQGSYAAFYAVTDPRRFTATDINDLVFAPDSGPIRLSWFDGRSSPWVLTASSIPGDPYRLRLDIGRAQSPLLELSPAIQERDWGLIDGRFPTVEWLQRIDPRVLRPPLPPQPRLPLSRDPGPAG